MNFLKTKSNHLKTFRFLNTLYLLPIKQNPSCLYGKGMVTKNIVGTGTLASADPLSQNNTAGLQE